MYKFLVFCHQQLSEWNDVVNKMKDSQVFVLWCLLEVAQSNSRHCHLF